MGISRSKITHVVIFTVLCHSMLCHIWNYLHYQQQYIKPSSSTLTLCVSQFFYFQDSYFLNDKLPSKLEYLTHISFRVILCFELYVTVICSIVLRFSVSFFFALQQFILYSSYLFFWFRQNVIFFWPSVNSECPLLNQSGQSPEKSLQRQDLGF